MSRSRRPLFVYFIQCGPHGPVKIGLSENVAQRVANLQTANPSRLAVMATIPGGYELERKLHAQFSSGLIGNEWFERDTPGLIEAIEHILRYGLLPPEPARDPGVDWTRCWTCGWAAEPELFEHGIRECWRCLKEKVADREAQADMQICRENGADSGSRYDTVDIEHGVVTDREVRPEIRRIAGQIKERTE